MFVWYGCLRDYVFPFLRKIFVGGLSWETTKGKEEVVSVTRGVTRGLPLYATENLEAYFAQYGQVKDAVIMMDPVTKKPR